MTRRILTSQPLRPRYQSRPYCPSPGRREHIHGKVLPMERSWWERWFGKPAAQKAVRS